MVAYLKARELDAGQGLMRMDGAYGWAKGAVIIRSHGLGYLMRCSDYRLLKGPEIKERLKEATAQPYVQIDTGKERQVLDLGEILWTVAADPNQSSKTRLIVGISNLPKDGSKPKVGKRIGNRVYELFVTERAPEGLSAVDIMGLYFARGGFERRLWEEDLEQNPDRWCSREPWGQELWQVLSQHVWNVRLKMGVMAQSAKARKIEWAAAVEESPNAEKPGSQSAGQEVQEGALCLAEGVKREETQKSAEPAPDLIQEIALKQERNEEPSREEEGERERPEIREEEPKEAARKPEIEPAPGLIRGEPAEDLGRGAGKIPAGAFTFTVQGELFCPMGKPLSLAENRQEGGRIRKIYQAKAKVCRSCKQKRKCLGHGASGKSGRRVSFLCGEAPSSNSTPEEAKGPRVEPGAGSVRAASREPEPGLTPKPMGRLPIYLVDLEATELRRKLSMDLRRQQVEIEVTKSRVSEGPEGSILTRDQVAHRRLTWAERLTRNASKPSGPSWFVQLYGIPEAIKVFFINSDGYRVAA